MNKANQDFSKNFIIAWCDGLTYSAVIDRTMVDLRYKVLMEVEDRISIPILMRTDVYTELEVGSTWEDGETSGRSSARF